METLDDIAVRHGTDKSSLKHDFAQVYEPFVAAWREKPIHMLEIGVLNGASLRTWHEYFPFARIWAIDVREEGRQHEQERVRIHIGHQKDPALLDTVLAESGPLDFVVDDGSHRGEDQQGSLLHLWPKLKPGGVYIMEDVHTSYREKWGMRYREPHTTMEFLKGVTDDINHRWHKQPMTLPDVRSIHFYFETCVICKRVDVGSPRGPRISEGATRYQRPGPER